MEISLRQRTPVQTLPLQGLMTHTTRTVMLGSCFAEEIGSRLEADLFDVTVNPFGTLYNPASIAKSINTLLSDRLYTADDLFEREGLWHSSDHHSRFSDSCRDTALSHINAELEAGRAAVRDADLCVITLGTSWIYTDATDGSVVANCHKRPASDFRRLMLTPDRSAMMLTAAIKRWLTVRPDLVFVLTVSPVRHLADGLHGNAVSKAALMLACEQIIGSVGRDHAVYFPSFEIMTDDLRDYRWYAADMKHPSAEAVDYIYRVFMASVCDRSTIALSEMCSRLTRRAAHRDMAGTPESAKSRADDLRRLSELITTAAPHLEDRIKRLLRDEF